MFWFLLLACGGSHPPAPAHPDVLLVTIDTLRADRVGAYGDPLANTPVLDDLAAHGALFRDAEATTPLTLPSHASILTGLYPLHHGMRDNAGFHMSTDVPTLAEALSGAGYHTGAFVSAYVLDSAWGLDRGFDRYFDDFDPKQVEQVGAFGEVSRPGDETVKQALSWWEGTNEPRFAWVHLFEPHYPWVPHRGSTGDPYRGEVAHADALVGRLLQAAGHDALVVVVSDHGEGLWDHGERFHGLLLGRSTTRVPLIVRPPGGLAGSEAPPARPGLDVAERPAGADPELDLTPVPDAPRAARVVETPVSTVDVAPTIADWCGVTLARTDGRSLRGAVEGGELPEIPVYAETFVPLFHYGWHELLMAQDGRHRLEVGAWKRLYDWRADPGGTGELSNAPAETHALQAVIERWRGSATPRPGPVSDRTTAALAALGYTTAPSPLPSDLPDPRDEVASMQDPHPRAANPAEALQNLRELVARQPNAMNIRVTLSQVLLAMGDGEGALQQLLAILDRQPDQPQALANASALARALGHTEQAVNLARRLQAVNPADPRGYRNEAKAWAAVRKPTQVLKAANAGLRVAPDDPELLFLAGRAELEAGDPNRAISELAAARARGSDESGIELLQAMAAQKAGHLDQAAEYYRAASDAKPNDPRPLAMAAEMFVNAGRCDDAKPFLEALVERGAGRAVQAELERCGML